jgi:XTP/dITP diphosphohydrolase
MKSLSFVSSNYNKYLEVQSVLSNYGINVEFASFSLIEIQSDSIKDIALDKCERAYREILKPVIVEDDGLFIDRLNGFPGQYSSYVFKTIGNMGILKLLENSTFRNACFRCVFAFNDGKNSTSFVGETKGKISYKITEGGWGYDPIFIPDSLDVTFGILQIANKKRFFSHRTKALNRFVEWYYKVIL